MTLRASDLARRASIASIEVMHRIAVLFLLIAVAPLSFAASPVARGAFLAFFVPDLEASVTWYQEKLGLEVVDRPAGSETAKVAILEGRGLIVELIQLKDAKPRAEGYQQGIFKAGAIVDDYDTVLATLKEKKVEIAFGPFPARGKQRANVIIRDNSGNLIQFFASR